MKYHQYLYGKHRFFCEKPLRFTTTMKNTLINCINFAPEFVDFDYSPGTFIVNDLPERGKTCIL